MNRNDREKEFLNELVPDEENSIVKYPYKKKLPLVLLLDTSSSMQGQSIDELNDGLVNLIEDIKNDEKTNKMVEICVVSFGGTVYVHKENYFVLAEDFKPKKMIANGNTPMGLAIDKGLELISQRKKFLRENGINLSCPWMIALTDGYPTDMRKGGEKWIRRKKALENAENGNHCLCWVFGTTNADYESLKDLYPKGRVLSMINDNFNNVFEFVSVSISTRQIQNASDYNLKMELD